jgi:imidazoleglycerol-phosphate dehydratase
MRTAEYTRKTRETEITAKVYLDGSGIAEIDTSIKFLDHMLTSLATHSLIDINIKARGDLQHHITEDTSLVLGEALYIALQVDKRIKRFADASVPMDESLAICCLDLGGRPSNVIDLRLMNSNTEDMANEDISHFIESLAISLRASIHIHVKYGSNNHHKAEAAFKALAKCLREATAIDPRRIEVPSSKGTL